MTRLVDMPPGTRFLDHYGRAWTRGEEHSIFDGLFRATRDGEEAKWFAGGSEFEVVEQMEKTE